MKSKKAAQLCVHPVCSLAFDLRVDSKRIPGIRYPRIPDVPKDVDVKKCS